VSPERPLWQRRLLPVLLALAFVNLVLSLAWTLPRGHRLRNAAARAEAARAELGRLSTQADALRARADAIRSNGQDLQRFYAKYAGKEQADLLPVLEEIERMARGPGLKPVRRSFARASVEDAPLERVAVTLPLQGSYPQLVAFLREVERSPRFLTVDRVALRGGSDGVADLQVELSAYMLATPGENGAGGRGD
jgi:Tfp pilus assembly protein PilO